ncbi:signal peptidase I [Paractinoplanes maris]|uniref:signal peptidase I n=1 Tax=Paractinoplanes maris TaxID=1734446 RepID=UPI0020225E1D|nr:signal peptidase I [Actinoplanes maris]
MIDEQTEKRRSSFWRELPILLGVAVLVAVLVRAFVLQTFYIPSPSMEHTLNVLDRVLVNKLVYDFRDPHRGEIIVFEAPSEWQSGAEGEDFIKRIIGIPGDKISFDPDVNKLSINGVLLDEPYIYHDADGQQDPPASREFEVTVPAGRLWVMGDHRSASGDSLEHFNDSGDNVQEATISEDSIVGRAFTVFWPVGRATWLTVPDGYSKIPDPK